MNQLLIEVRNMLPCRLAVMIGALFGLSNVLDAGDWTEFRGPTGQGHAPNAHHLPIEWSKTENVRWSVDIPGLGWSSPIVLDDRVYLTTATDVPGGAELDKSLRTLCLDVDSGEAIWNVEVFRQNGNSAKRPHKKNSHASPTPITDGRHLFVHFGPQGTACLNLKGDVIWRQQLTYQPVHGNGGSPILVDDLLIMTCDGGKDPFVVALDKATGDIRWKKPRPNQSAAKKFSFCTPLLIEVARQRQVVCPGSDLVIAYDPNTGRELWQVDYNGYSVIPRPVFAHGLIFMSTGYDRPTILAIRPGSRRSRARIEWRWSRGAPNTPSLIVVGKELYCVSDRGIATCLDAKTGRLNWQERLGGNFSASPIFADGRIYFQSEEGRTTVIDPGPKFQEVGRNELDGRTFASFAVVDNAILLRTERALYRLEQLSP